MNDYAGLLPAADRDRLERLIAERELATGTQMAIAIFPSLEGESLEDFSIRLAERWRIGHKGLDNGVILVVFVQDRKLRFEVGYGLEPVVPDIVAGQIIREVVAPRFREGRFAAGLEGAVTAVYARVKDGGEAKAPPAKQPKGVDLGRLAALVVVGVVIAFLASAWFGNAARRSPYTLEHGRWRSARRGGMLGFPFGVWWGSRGGGWGGHGGGGGGFGSGGGFSGGGGGFGGGGASGDW